MKADIFIAPTTPTLSAGWSVVSADKLCAHPPPTPPELIHGLLYEGGTLMLSGPSKAHKTYTMLAAAHAIATGGQWLGFDTTKAPVLYLNLELQDFAVTQRLRAITASMRDQPSPNLHLVNLRGVMVGLPALQANLRAMIEHTGARLVIIDPHYKISSASGVEENSNDAQAKFLYEVETACTKNGAAVMIAHHFAKGDASAKKSIDRAAGGGAIARWGDVIMTLTEHEEPECMTVEFSLRNFAPVSPFVVRWEHPLWVREDQFDPAKLRKVGRTEVHTADAAFRALGDEPCTWSEWFKSSKMSESTFRRKVRELEVSGKVLRAGQVYRKAA